jgi:hypothetical protein
MNQIFAAAAMLAVAGIATSASATTVTINVGGTNANNQSAAATFTLNDVANTVSIRIQNNTTSTSGARDLSALFWSFSGAGPLGVVYDNAPVNNGTWNATNVTSSNGGVFNMPPTYSAEQLWGYGNNLSGAPLAATHGLSSAGLGIFDPLSLLESGGPDPQPDGPDGAIVVGSASHAGRPQFRDFVEFVFTTDAGFFSGGIGNISVTNLTAQFNTGLISGEQVRLTVVPLPPAVWAALSSLACVAGFGMIRHRKNAAV